MADVMPVPMRADVLMICAHEPSLDPRIRWEAEAAARRFDVTVLGFKRDDDSAPERDSGNGYRIVRLARPAVSVAYFLWRLKDILPRAMYITLAALALLLTPVLLLAEIGGRSLRRSSRNRASGLEIALAEALVFQRNGPMRSHAGIRQQRNVPDLGSSSSWSAGKSLSRPIWAVLDWFLWVNLIQGEECLQNSPDGRHSEFTFFGATASRHVPKSCFSGFHECRLALLVCCGDHLETDGGSDASCSPTAEIIC